jgi:peptidoglycan/LPS O-acetylase OafA/YrhL
LVVAYHADVAAFSGGFTGVDIFFVISGFLITRIVVDELRGDRFSLLEFYKRRALRILPAYVVLILAVIAAAYFLLLPPEARRLGVAVAASAAFVSNIYFWRVTDYFNPASDTEPLLHTWTLSVEEQFYILLPLGLLLVARYLRGRYALLILAGSALSFLLSIWGLSRSETATFYLLPPRAWELGCGAFLAVAGMSVVRGAGAKLRGPAAAAGLALVGYGAFGLGAESPYPGPNALFPALGALLLIACAEGTRAGRLLSTWPLVAVGKISYSLYLWHWPIIAFYKMRSGPVLEPAEAVLVIVLSVVLAALSYAYIEQPFRTPAMRARQASLIDAAAASTIVATALVGVAVAQIAGTWRSYPEDVRRIASFLDYRGTPEWHRVIGPAECMIHEGTEGGFERFSPEVCLPQAEDRPSYLLLGDSYAGHLMHALERRMPHINLQVAGASGCQPTLGAAGARWCEELMRLIFDEHVPGASLDGVILAAHWREEDLRPLQATVDFLADHVDRIVVLGPTVEYEGSFPALLARSRLSGDDRLERFLDRSRRRLDARMKSIEWNPATEYVSIYDLLCSDGTCPRTTANNVPFHFDHAHFTLDASHEVAALLDRLGVIDPPSPRGGARRKARRDAVHR